MSVGRWACERPTFTEDSVGTLRRWRKVVRRETRRLRHVSEHTHGIDRHLAKSWARVKRAIDDVVAEQEAESLGRE